jgi:hypothetical protein
MTEWLKTAIDNTTAMMTGDRGGYKYTEYDSQGRWLADYIMDSPDKATAKVVKKVNMNGTAYSRTGVEGPYDTGIMADGTIIGKYIKAHSITTEQISQSYTDHFEDADTGLDNRITTEVSTLNNTISLKVSGVQTDLNNVRTNLQSQITVNANGIQSKVSKGQVRSQINQESDLISITANKFMWSSNYSSLTQYGILTATSAVLKNCNVTGTFECGSSSYSAESTSTTTTKNRCRSSRSRSTPPARGADSSSAHPARHIWDCARRSSIRRPTRAATGRLASQARAR